MSGVPVEQVEEYQKYSGYFLIDIRVTFIMTYVYITVINLISTTANNEANQDTESPLLFNVTSRPEHTNVTVNSIDDATLWSCREHSPTSSYYVTLYWMLLATLSLTLLFYSVSKSFALWSINGLNSLNDIWHMAEGYDTFGNLVRLPRNQRKSRQKSLEIRKSGLTSEITICHEILSKIHVKS